MKKYPIILEIILILLCTNSCKKQESSKDKPTIPKEPNTTLTMKFGSFQEGYNIRNPIEIELELTNHSSENCIIPWYDDSLRSNAEFYLRPANTNDKWLKCYFSFVLGNRFPPKKVEMVIPPHSTLNFWALLAGLGSPRPKFTTGKYQVYASLVERPDVKTTLHKINIYDKDEHLQKREMPSFSSASDLLKLKDPNEENIPFDLKIKSLPEKVYYAQEVEIVLELHNKHQYAVKGVDPWYFYDKFNIQMYGRSAGTNDEWSLIKQDDFPRSYALPKTSGVMEMYPSIRYNRIVPPKGKLTFHVPVRFRFSPDKYEVYARLSALPKVKTDIKIIHAVKEEK